MFAKATVLSVLLAGAELVSGHAALINAVGDAGGVGMALGVDTSTPRDGTRRNPFQQDATRFRGTASATVGETLAGGDNNIEAGTQAIMAETGSELPQVSAGGKLEMTLHQVNGDGAGPYTCKINSDGTAAQWTPITVTTQVPGTNSRNRDGAETDFPLVASIPDSQTCTGTVAGQENVCLVRCENSARAGPFGGVVPVQMAGAGAGAGAGTGAGAARNGTAPATAERRNVQTRARRALARDIVRREALLRKVMKRAMIETEEDIEDDEE
ncbi:hypothetical protein MCOR25_002065 [Pyricularia grisea]|uniref:CAS1 protein n=1 Tax=Pyricularia grisea TaxID=148305 RepID=A0A6P8AMD3_PYRGI|nr:uncharacterized protein PgNI_12401 [Pyricularia grisea]KAI6379187.1 hypothetical protein MCOR25_002065 [Pyricularia grisea]TLD03187.1 hypothetical protein PgNI_12401 [Pyricularia grisea]